MIKINVKVPYKETEIAFLLFLVEFSFEDAGDCWAIDDKSLLLSSTIVLKFVLFPARNLNISGFFCK